MRDQQDMHPASEQRIQRREKLRHFLREHDVAFAVAELLDARLVRAPADFLDEQLLQPVRRIHDERLEFVRLDRERGDDFRAPLLETAAGLFFYASSFVRSSSACC